MILSYLSFAQRALLGHELKFVQSKIEEKHGSETTDAVGRAITEIESYRNHVNQTPFVPEEKQK